MWIIPQSGLYFDFVSLLKGVEWGLKVLTVILLSDGIKKITNTFMDEILSVYEGCNKWGRSTLTNNDADNYQIINSKPCDLFPEHSIVCPIIVWRHVQWSVCSVSLKWFDMKSCVTFPWLSAFSQHELAENIVLNEKLSSKHTLNR